MRKRYIVAGVLVLAVIAFVVYRMGREAGPVVETVQAERGTVEHIVNVTGHAEPLTRLDLAFTQGGRISSLPIREGDRVARGEILAVLDQPVGEASVSEAAERATRERALLMGVLVPTTPADVAVQDAAVAQANAARAQTYVTARATLARAYVQAHDALEAKIDELFDKQGENSYKYGTRFRYGTTEYILSAPNEVSVGLSSARSRMGEVLVRLQSYSDVSDGELGDTLRDANADLAMLEQFASDVADAVNRYVPDDTQTQSVYESFQTGVASARTAISAARADVVTAASTLSSAASTLTAAEAARAQLMADPLPSSVAAQEAAVRAARAGVTTAEAALVASRIFAPIAGIVSKVSFDRGEAVGPYEPVVELIGSQDFELVAYVPEADIARVKLGDRAEVTFDAFDSNTVFTAEVVRIALSETVRDGVPTYKTTLVLVELPEGVTVRSGMTADIDIHTDERLDVVYVPTRTVLTDAQGQYVRVLRGGEIVHERVTTGLRGSEGTVEVLSGVREGEEVVLFVEEETT